MPEIKEPFFDRIFIGDGEWVVYDNVLSKPNWKQTVGCSKPVANTGSHPMNVLFGGIAARYLTEFLADG